MQSQGAKWLLFLIKSVVSCALETLQGNKCSVCPALPSRNNASDGNLIWVQPLMSIEHIACTSEHSKMPHWVILCLLTSCGHPASCMYVIYKNPPQCLAVKGGHWVQEHWDTANVGQYIRLLLETDQPCCQDWHLSQQTSQEGQCHSISKNCRALQFEEPVKVKCGLFRMMAAARDLLSFTRKGNLG